MNTIVKTLLILGFVCLGGGIVISYELFGRNSLDMPGNNRAIEIWALSFWYLLEPVIGILLIFARGKKVSKLFGAFFLITSLCAWIKYFSLK